MSGGAFLLFNASADHHSWRGWHCYAVGLHSGFDGCGGAAYSFLVVPWRRIFSMVLLKEVK